MHLSASDRGMHGSVSLSIVGCRNAVGCGQLLLLALYSSTFELSSEMQVTVLCVTGPYRCPVIFLKQIMLTIQYMLYTQ